MSLPSRFLLAAAVMTLLSAAQSSAQDAEWAKVIEAAKKEGKVVLYTSTQGVEFHNQALRSFQAKYGITTELLDVRASELDQRIQTEQTSGRYVGDVLQHGEASAIRHEQNGVFQPYISLPNFKNLQQLFKDKSSNVRIPIYVSAYGLLINSDLVRGEDEPKSWWDLLNPKWKGKIMADDFRALGGGSVWFDVTYRAFGREFHEKLSKQNIVFSRDVGNDQRRVARGEYPMRLPQHYSNFPQLEGLPVKLIQPVEGASYVEFDSGILKNAPHPNAARLFLDHYIGETVQVIYANNALVPVAVGVAEKADPKWRSITGAKLLGTSSPERLDAMLALAKEIYK